MATAPKLVFDTSHDFTPPMSAEVVDGDAVDGDDADDNSNHDDADDDADDNSVGDDVVDVDPDIQAAARIFMLTQLTFLREPLRVSPAPFGIWT
jgi:hypothetical protein